MKLRMSVKVLPLVLGAFLVHGVAGGWKCGQSLEERSIAQPVVEREYSTFKATFLQTMSSDGSQCCVMRPGQSNDCVSEGIGYAMLLAAYLSDETTGRQSSFLSHLLPSPSPCPIHSISTLLPHLSYLCSCSPLSLRLRQGAL